MVTKPKLASSKLVQVLQKVQVISFLFMRVFNLAGCFFQECECKKYDWHFFDEAMTRQMEQTNRSNQFFQHHHFQPHPSFSVFLLSFFTISLLLFHSLLYVFLFYCSMTHSYSCSSVSLLKTYALYLRFSSSFLSIMYIF